MNSSVSCTVDSDFRPRCLWRYSAFTETVSRMKSTTARKPPQKEEKWGVGDKGRDAYDPPPTYFFPWCLVVELPLNLSRDKAAQGIIHLPDPFSFSSALAGTFCAPPHTTTTPHTPALKHKTASVRNSRIHFSFPAPPTDCEGAQRRSRRGRRYRATGGRHKLGDTLEATNEPVEEDERGEESRQERNKQRKTTARLSAPPIQLHTHSPPPMGGHPRRLIGYFGLEKWISPSLSSPQQKTAFLPNQLTNELIDLLFIIQRAHWPPPPPQHP